MTKNGKEYMVDFRGKTVCLGDSSKIMGIINLTPDSFSDGGDFFSPEAALHQALEMEKAGADFLDLGAESARPGHIQITADEEIARLIPALSRILSESNLPISVDTWKSQVAEVALQTGAHLINDIYGLRRDPKLASVIARHKAGVIIMHNQDTKDYPQGLTSTILNFFKESIRIALEAGIQKERIILDPGIGFAKTPEQNLKLMGELSQFTALGFPLLLGASRKSLIGAVIPAPPKERLPATIATTVLGITQGFQIFRVHDVAENLQAARFTDAVTRRQNGYHYS